MFTTATAPTSGAQVTAASGASTIPTRITPNAPSFINTPACSMLTAVGAEAWPSGLQVWKGNTPASVPKPSQSRGKTHICVERGKGTAASWPRSKVRAPARDQRPRMATRMAAEPTRSIRVSFIAAYSRLPTANRLQAIRNGPRGGTWWLLPQIPISRYMGRTAIS